MLVQTILSCGSFHQPTLTAQEIYILIAESALHPDTRVKAQLNPRLSAPQNDPPRQVLHTQHKNRNRKKHGHKTTSYNLSFY